MCYCSQALQKYDATNGYLKNYFQQLNMDINKILSYESIMDAHIHIKGGEEETEK